MSQPTSLTVSLTSLRKSLPSSFEYARHDRIRALRSDSKANILKVLSFLVSHTDIVSNRIVWKLSRNQGFRHVTAGLVAARVGLSTKTVFRIFDTLKSLGYLQVEQQPRPEYVRGLALFASSCRRFTDAFWKALGTLKEVLQDRQWAADRLPIPVFRAVCKKLIWGKNASPTSNAAPTHPQKPIWLQLKELEEWGKSLE